MQTLKNRELVLNIVGAAMAIGLLLACTSAQTNAIGTSMATGAAVGSMLANPNPVIVVPAR